VSEQARHDGRGMGRRPKIVNETTVPRTVLRKIRRPGISSREHVITQELQVWACEGWAT
jgi:hypothetical protein